jgi:hyperosmotically inducible periplasmic protein
MKTHIMIACALAVAAPAALFASTAIDHQIENAAENSYNFKVVLNGQVHAKADGGAVVLTGTVFDNANKKLAEDTVAELPGVVSVDDEIAVDATVPPYTDSWIALQIRGLLLIKANVSAADTKVTVKDGVVTLDGSVQNAAQRDLTETYVRGVRNVKSVIDNLVVRAPEPSENPVAKVVDDASITAQVKCALLADSNTSAIRTKVTTANGIVIVTGEAGSNSEKDIVTRIARSIRGVYSVENLMSVKS